MTKETHLFKKKEKKKEAKQEQIFQSFMQKHLLWEQTIALNLFESIDRAFQHSLGHMTWQTYSPKCFSQSGQSKRELIWHVPE